METSFGLGRFLKKHEIKYKAIPEHLKSVAGGVQRRMQQTFKKRKSSRLSIFDNLRDLNSFESPIKAIPDKKSEIDHKRLQLEKWKQKKEEKKKEAAAQKKKPFLVGAAPSALPPAPPPPPRKALPSTSGRVTRSQTLKQNNVKQTVDTKATIKTQSSFAPTNASFQASHINNDAVIKKNKKEKVAYKFDPIQKSNFNQNSIQCKSKTLSNNVTRETAIDLLKCKETSPRKQSISKTMQSSSSGFESSTSLLSSSEDEFKSSTEMHTQKSLESSSNEEEIDCTETCQILKITPQRSLPRNTNIATRKNAVPKSESSSEGKLRSPKSPVEQPVTPEQIAEEAKKISPCVTLSRGKDNARREIKNKVQVDLLDEDTSNIDSVNSFRRQLASEIKRMTEMCEIWEKILEQTPLADSIQEMILSTVGQARLLMTRKLAQFATLVERCACPEPGQVLVTPADLAGFWDMVYMQIEDIDMRFMKLEEIKKRNWVEDAPAEVKRKVVPKNNNAKKTAKPAANIRLRDMIAAARKAKQQQEAPSKSVESDGENKTFEGGFFCVLSPVRSPVRSTPVANNSLLKGVLSNEAKKSASKNSSFAMLRAFILSKNMKHDGKALLPQTPINLEATPSCSILKSAASEKKSVNKSIKVVLFDDSDSDIQERSESNEEPFKSFDKQTDNNVDSLKSFVEKENEEINKGNSTRKSKLIRQAAITDSTGVMTRRRLKSLNITLTDLDKGN